MESGLAFNLSTPNNHFYMQNQSSLYTTCYTIESKKIQVIFLLGFTGCYLVFIIHACRWYRSSVCQNSHIYVVLIMLKNSQSPLWSFNFFTGISGANYRQVLIFVCINFYVLWFVFSLLFEKRRCLWKLNFSRSAPYKSCGISMPSFY